MPSRNTLKVYVKGAYYHVYNRGVAKQPIFTSQQDYLVFIKYLKEALVEPKRDLKIFTITTLQGQSFKGVTRQPKNFISKIELIAYCLMPNHFHLLIKQTEKTYLEAFMRSMVTRYSAYFNKSHDRVGHVFQGRYKAVMIENDRYLLHLSRYIHLNPSEYAKDLTKAYSSYPEYLGIRKTDWIKPEIILKFFNNPVNPEFKKVNSYKNFVENYKTNSESVLGDLTLESE